MQTWTYVSFVGVLLMKWIYGLAAADDLESLCATADTPYLQALCAEDAAPKKIHRTARALSEDYFLRFGKGDPLFESKRFMRFGRNYGGSLDDALEIALKKVQDLERNTGIKLRRRRSAETPSENEEAHPENEDSRVKRDSSNAETNTPDEKDSALVDKRFMRFGRGGDEIDKRFMRFGRSGEMDKRFMRFGRAEKRFMRFGRDPGMYDEFEDNIPEKRFMRFGKRFMRFGRSGDIDEDDDTFEPEDKRFMRFGKRFMRFGRSGGDLDKRFMRFGRSGADMDKRFMRFGRSDNSPDKRFMRFGRSDGSVDKRFMRFGKREAPNQSEES